MNEDPEATPHVLIVEDSIDDALLTRRALRVTLLLLGVQMAGTLAPLVLFPSELFLEIPWAPTLEGQYILKNSILIRHLDGGLAIWYLDKMNYLDAVRLRSGPEKASGWRVVGVR